MVLLSQPLEGWNYRPEPEGLAGKSFQTQVCTWTTHRLLQRFSGRTVMVMSDDDVAGQGWYLLGYLVIITKRITGVLSWSPH